MNAVLSPLLGAAPQPTGVVDFVGNRTECALLVMMRKLGVDYDKVRQERSKDQIKVRHGSARCLWAACRLAVTGAQPSMVAVT